MMIGNGTPSSQSNAPRPKPMLSSILLLWGRRAAKGKVPGGICSQAETSPQCTASQARIDIAHRDQRRCASSHQLNGHEGGVGLTAKRTGGGSLGALRTVRTRAFAAAGGGPDCFT